MELWREQSGVWSIQWLFTSCYRSSKYFKNCCTLLFNVAKDQYFAYLWDECIRLSLQGWISLDWFNEVSMILPSPYICHILVIQFLDKIESASLGFFLACFCVCGVYFMQVCECLYKYMTAHAYVWTYSGDLRLMSAVFHSYSPHYSLRYGLPVEPRAHQFA